MNSKESRLAPPGRIGEVLAAAARALDRLTGLPPAVLIGTASVLFMVLSLVEMHGENVTNDELVHLSAGYSYLKTRDFRLNPEHPPLAKLIAGLPLLALNPALPKEAAAWKEGDEWPYGYYFFYQSGNSAERLLFWGRLPMIGWGILLLAATYLIARTLFGPDGGLVALVLMTFCPTLIGHGHLVTTDVPVAAMSLLATAAYQRFLDRPGWTRAALAGAAFGGAVLTKYSAVLLLPAFLLMSVVRWKVRPVTVVPSAGVPSDTSERRISRLRWAAYLALIGGVTLTCIWALYGFRFRASPDSTFAFDWQVQFSKGTSVTKAVAFARRYQLLPEAFLNGFLYMSDQAQVRSAFAFGNYSVTGWWWYFPAAFLVKNPLCTLLILALGARAYVRRSREGTTRDHFLVIPLIIYGVFSISGRLNIGIRHFFPVFPLLFILGAGAVRQREGSPGLPGRGLIALLLAGVVVECSLGIPYSLAYFNGPSLAVWKRHEMLVDSNLDWGQDLSRLKAYMTKNGIPSLKLAYFGNGSPRQLGLDHEMLPSPNMYQDYEPEWKPALRYRGGEWVAISATTMSGALEAYHDYYLKRFGAFEPVAEIGHSVLLYRVPDGWEGLKVEPFPKPRTEPQAPAPRK
jgi:hypothetical protein